MTETISETPDIRLKRLKMRSWRRGTKEMDLILGPYSDKELAVLSAENLDLYEQLLDENDQDLYQWVSGQLAAPSRYSGILDLIRTANGLSQNYAKL